MMMAFIIMANLQSQKISLLSKMWLEENVKRDRQLIQKSQLMRVNYLFQLI
nr:MAG TPA: hypothetical protein [Caudoviricetes sp.]